MSQAFGLGLDEAGRWPGVGMSQAIGLGLVRESGGKYEPYDHETDCKQEYST